MSAATSRAGPTPHTGQIIASFGRRYLVDLGEGKTIECVTRGKRSDAACGDEVSLRLSGVDSGVIEDILPRTTLLYRSDAHRQKLIAANVSQALIVVAAVPSFYIELIDRCLAACEHAGIAPLIVLNKCDLPESEAATHKLAPYDTLGYRLLRLAAKQDVAPLQPLLAGHTSVLVGQSGMGKSTIVNRLVPEAAQRVADVSVALDSGKHTTTGARLTRLDSGTSLIDSPGLQVFGLHHIALPDLARAFVEFRPLLGQCRFRDCTHRVEPDCAIELATQAGRILPSRLGSYRSLAQEALRAKEQRYR